MSTENRDGYDPQSQEAAEAQGQDQAVEQQPLTPEQRGEMRYQAAKEGISRKFDTIKGIASKAGGFLKRLGFNILGAPEHAKNAFNAGKEAVSSFGNSVTEAGKRGIQQTKENYKHVSEGVKGKAVEVGGRISEAIGRVNATKERIFEGAKNKWAEICGAGNAFRKDIITGIENNRLKQRATELEQQMQQEDSEHVDDEDTVKRLLARIEARKTARESLEDEYYDVMDKIKQSGPEAAESPSQA